MKEKELNQEQAPKKKYYGGGRKKGKITEPYEKAIMEYFTKGGRITDLAKKYNIDRSGLSVRINSTKKSTLEELGTDDIGTIARDTQEAIITGVKNLEVMQKSTNDVVRALAENTIDKIRETNITLARNLQIVGGKILKDLDDETTRLRQEGKMDLNNIHKAFLSLNQANQVIGIPKTPTQINILNQNNQQNNINGNNGGLGITIEIIDHNEQKAKDKIKEFIDIDLNDDES